MQNSSKTLTLNLRAVATRYVYQVLVEGKSLSSLLALPTAFSSKDQALVQEITFGVMRNLPRLEKILTQLLERPLKGKKFMVHCLLLVGLYQLLYTRVPAFACVNEVVEATQALNLKSFRALVNGVLRQFLRKQEAILAQADKYWHSMHPDWLINLLKPYYTNWQAILEANNHKPPMWLRVNPTIKVSNYAKLLQEQGVTCDFESTPPAIRLHKPASVNQLPNFEQGLVTVQDLHAQWAGILLEPQNNEMILDACSAPGGKTTHILELAPKAKIMALDIDDARLQRVQENLHRCGMQAEVVCGDARYPATWLKNMDLSQPIFDRILLDAPCSATGVIRRHPDIKWLRQEQDIKALVVLQTEILDSLWQLLKLNGTLLYATCSVLPMENSVQIQNFLARTPNARLEKLNFNGKLSINSEGWKAEHESLSQVGKQFFPTVNGGDGFYYAKLKKIND